MICISGAGDFEMSEMEIFFYGFLSGIFFLGISMIIIILSEMLDEDELKPKQESKLYRRIGR